MQETESQYINVKQDNNSEPLKFQINKYQGDKNNNKFANQVINQNSQENKENIYSQQENEKRQSQMIIEDNEQEVMDFQQQILQQIQVNTEFQIDATKEGPEYQYAKPIFDYLRKIEGKFLPKHDYMLEQEDINVQMRGILIDWLIDVHLKFKLVPETLFQTINLIDRYLQNNAIQRTRLQLVGITAMFIASKYEEIYAPEIHDFVYICDKAYTKEEILEMEGLILLSTDFNLTYTSPLRFLERYSDLMQCCQTTFYLARYLIELSLIEFKMLKYDSSTLAGCSLLLANKIIQNNKQLTQNNYQPDCFWNKDLQMQSGYQEDYLKAGAKDLLVLMTNIGKSSLQAVKKKFQKISFKEVANISIISQNNNQNSQNSIGSKYQCQFNKNASQDTNSYGQSQYTQSDYSQNNYQNTNYSQSDIQGSPVPIDSEYNSYKQSNFGSNVNSNNYVNIENNLQQQNGPQQFGTQTQTKSQSLSQNYISNQKS